MISVSQKKSIYLFLSGLGLYCYCILYKNIWSLCKNIFITAMLIVFASLFSLILANGMSALHPSPYFGLCWWGGTDHIDIIKICIFKHMIRLNEKICFSSFLISSLFTNPFNISIMIIHSEYFIDNIPDNKSGLKWLSSLIIHYDKIISLIRTCDWSEWATGFDCPI